MPFQQIQWHCFKNITCQYTLLILIQWNQYTRTTKHTALNDIGDIVHVGDIELVPGRFGNAPLWCQVIGATWPNPQIACPNDRMCVAVFCAICVSVSGIRGRICPLQKVHVRMYRPLPFSILPQPGPVATAEEVADDQRGTELASGCRDDKTDPFCTVHPDPSQGLGGQLALPMGTQ